VRPNDVRRVLIDENLAIRLRLWLPSVEAVTVEHLGWKGVRNGELMRRAKAEGFAAFVTADRPLALARHLWAPLGCVHVNVTDAARLRRAAERIDHACSAVLPGQLIHIVI
jgi:predicted nuclease of predicted toxin-antitoxin system